MDADNDRIERLRRALVLARAGLERAPAERAAWLARETAGDDALRDEAWALLQLDAVPQHAFERIGEGADEPVDPLLGSTVGPFRVDRRIGSGGMGTVYRATPVAGVTRQPVALKVVKRGMDSEDVLARFMRERQILAGLAHPNIARLLDGGLTGDGRPWFALELVDGDPLTAWCDARRLGLARRVELFLGACEAVAYAHRNLVVHRDLKPPNVLVTAGGEVKLLDFGIAKLLDGATDATRATRLAMTPEYAAPEQFSVGPITTQTDVYQLGLLLHELLAGRRAQRSGEGGNTARFDADDDDGLLAERATARGTTAAALQRSLRGDIARIVRRAMHHDVARRYASVAALADDLRRWLRNEPVSATDDTLAYRARMFLRRHRAAAGAAAAIVLALGVGLGLALREARELRRAERSTENALGLLEDVFLGADPWRSKGGDTRATDLLAHARKRIAADSAHDPAIAARLLGEIGAVYVSLGDRASAEGTLREAVRAGELAGAAAALQTDAARARLAHYRLVVDGDRGALADLDAAIAGLRASGDAGRLPLAQALEFKVDDAFNTGDYAAIPPLSNEAVQLYKAASGDASIETSGALGNQASLLRAIGRPADALAPAAEGWRIVGKLGEAAPPGAYLYAEQQYAGALAANGRGAEAEPLLRDALSRARAEMSTDRDLVDGIAWELASTQATIGRFDDAASGLRELLMHVDMKSANVAAVHNMLGSTEFARGRAQAAREAYVDATKLLCGEGPTTPPCVVVRLNLAEALVALGAAEAAPALRALDVDIGSADGRPRHRWQLLEARRLAAAGQLDAARAQLAPLLDAARAAPTPALDDANVLAEIAGIEARAGERDAALADYHAAERRLAAIWVGEPPQLATIRARIAQLDGTTDAAAAAVNGP